MSAWALSPKDFLGSINSANLPVVPERAETIDAQMRQLHSGIRRVVMVPTGTKMPSGIPKTMGTIRVPPAGNFIFQKGQISPREIRRAVKFNSLTDILGATDGGMGAPDKTELQGPVAAIEGKDAQGQTVQGTLADQENMGPAMEQTAKVTPPGGSVSVVDPGQVIAERQRWAISPEQFLQETA